MIRTSTGTRTGTRTALLLVDLQRWIVAMDLAPIPGPVVVERCAEVYDQFRSAGAPVVFIRYLRPGAMTPGDQWTPDLAPSAEDLVISKSGLDAFAGTDLHDRLSELEVQRVVIAGIATAHGVAATAYTASRLRYETTVIVDSVASIGSAEHDAAIESLAKSGISLVPAAAFKSSPPAAHSAVRPEVHSAVHPAVHHRASLPATAAE